MIHQHAADQRATNYEARIPLLFPTSNFFWQDAKYQLAAKATPRR
jgi:hypothetical protein